MVGLENEVQAIIARTLNGFARIQTCENLAGVHAMIQNGDQICIATPYVQPGSVQLTHYLDHKLQADKNKVIPAHKGRISQLALSKDLRLLATTSDKGTVVRLWNPLTGVNLHELRRGSNPATI